MCSIKKEMKVIRTMLDSITIKRLGTTLSELGNGSALSFRAPKDSTVRFRLFGNEINDVKWVVVTKLSHCYMGCPRDTFAFGGLSLNPQKFETFTSSIDY